MKNKKVIKNILKNPIFVLSLVMVLGLASFLFYQTGFSLEVNLNGKVVGYARNNETVTQAISSVEDSVLQLHGEDAYFAQVLETEKVRNHKDDVVEVDALSESISRQIEIYKPASVILVDKQETVAVESKEMANELLDELKKPYQKDVKDRKVVKVYFDQEVSVIDKDVLVEDILSNELAMLPFIGDSVKTKTAKADFKGKAHAASPISNLLDSTNLKDIETNEDIHTDIENKMNLKAKTVKLDIISVMEEKETVSIEYETEKEKDDSLFTDETEVTQKGKDGKKEITHEITLLNGKEISNEKTNEEVIKEPTTKIVAKGTKERPQVEAASATATTTPAYTTAYNGSSSNAIVNIAWQQVNNGVPYVFGGASPSGFDCSGLTYYVYGQAGIGIPRTASGQANWGNPVAKANLQPGDLVLFLGSTGNTVGHAGIYIGNGNMIHSPVPGMNVSVTSIHAPYFAARFVTARRA